MGSSVIIGSSWGQEVITPKTCIGSCMVNGKGAKFENSGGCLWATVGYGIDCMLGWARNRLVC
jgi:hypothetical protein